jgi:hypothetical protein
MAIIADQPQADKKCDSIIDRAILGAHEARFDQGERNGKIARETVIIAGKAKEVAHQGLIKGMDALKRASENPEATKKAVKEAFGGRLDKMKAIFGRDSGSSA